MQKEQKYKYPFHLFASAAIIVLFLAQTALANQVLDDNLIASTQTGVEQDTQMRSSTESKTEELATTTSTPKPQTELEADSEIESADEIASETSDLYTDEPSEDVDLSAL